MTNHIIKYIIKISIVIALLSSYAVAEEGGSGHYVPGSIASFMDGVSADPTFVARLNYLHYDGDMGAERRVPIAGQTALNVNAKSNAVGLTLFWAPDIDLGDKWSYAMSTTIPWVSMEVTADVGAGPFTVRRQSKETGLGDIVIMPVMFNYQYSADFNINSRLAIYAPTGSYKVGRLANLGKNYWTIEPTIGFIYFGQKNGIEGSLFLGADFNTENNDTDYKSGTQVHLDGTLAQHFPLWSGLAGIGVTGFWYEQVEGDSGDGATLGAFKGVAHGIGPVASWVTKVGGMDVIAELKWTHEFDNENRTEGDIVFFKLLGKF